MSSQTNPLSALAIAELAAAAAPIQAALTAIANGDGSVASLTGQGVALEGELIAILPTLQKVGVNTIAADLNAKITAWLATQASAVTPAPQPAPAALCS